MITPCPNRNLYITDTYRCMRSLLLIISFISLSLPVESRGQATTEGGRQSFSCRQETRITRQIADQFITADEWRDVRSKIGMFGYEKGNLELLHDSTHARICEELNSMFSDEINQKIPTTNDSMFRVAYYKVGRFYLVITQRAQASDPSIISLGLSFLEIYDEHLQRLAGYSF